jgi:hypothetical protein
MFAAICGHVLVEAGEGPVVEVSYVSVLDGVSEQVVQMTVVVAFVA